MSRELKISYLWQDGDRWIEKIYNLSQIEAGDHYSDMSDCPFLKNYRVVTRRQYIGRNDKNGKEIYEGDIVQGSTSFQGGALPHMGEIVYLEKFGAFATKNLGGETLLHHHILNTFEIIGNIYENPELVNDNEN